MRWKHGASRGSNKDTFTNQISSVSSSFYSIKLAHGCCLPISAALWFDLQVCERHFACNTMLQSAPWDSRRIMFMHSNLDKFSLNVPDR